MRYGLLALGVTALATAAASAAEAQVTPTAMIAGRQERALNVRGTADVEYDSNVANASPEEAALQHITPADTVYTPQATVDFVMPIGRQAIFLAGTASYLYHETNRQLDHDRINLTAGVGNSLGPCGTVVSGSYATGRTQLADQILVTNVENVLTTESANVALACSRPSGLGLVANGAVSHTSNSALQLTSADIDNSTASGGVSYRSSSGTISLLGNYSKSSYPQRLDIAGQSTGYESTGADIQVSRRLGGKIQLGATVGFTAVTPNSPPVGALPGDQGKFRGLIYSGDASFRASSRLTTSLTFSRQVTPTLQAGQSFEVLSSYAASVDYKIGSRITAHAGAQFSDSDSHGGVVSDPALSLTRSKVTVLLASLRYQQSKRLSLILHTQHEQRTADNPRFAYDGYRVGLTAGVNF